MLEMSWKRKLAGAMCAPSFAIGAMAGGQTLLANDASNAMVVIDDQHIVLADADAPDMKVSGTFGIDINTHFISWGYDVWSQGDDWGSKKTLNPYGELAFDLGFVTATVGTWWDVNDNTSSEIGGNLQEVDMIYGLSTSWDKFTFGVTYQDWYYGGQTEKVFDISVGFDDSGMWGDAFGGDFALSPSFVAHRLSSGGEIAGVKDTGWAYALSVAPEFTLIDSETTPLTLTVPVTALFGDSDFYADSGFASLSVGAMFSMPASFIPSEYGEWSITAGVTYYWQDDDAIPDTASGGVNPDDEFLTGTIGMSMSF